MFFRSIILGSLIALSRLTLSVQAKTETCIPIPLVGGKGNQVIKTVSPPTIPAGPLGMLGVNITNNDWNTDWAVPLGDGKPFRRFLVTLLSNDGGPFEVRMYLKYGDQTSDEFYNQKSLKLANDKPLKIEAIPRANNQPYQVNVFVAGIDALGKSYSATVVGCR
jgi:hypothetical protein